MKLLSTIIVIILMLGCGEDKESNNYEGIGLKDGIYEEYLTRVESTKHPQVEAGEQKYTLLWDFTHGPIEYEYHQEVTNETKMSLMKEHSRDGVGQNLRASGKIFINPKENNTANLILKNMVVNHSMKMGVEDMNISQEIPTMVIQGMRENGSVKLGDAERAQLVHLLFPLPDGPISIGETVSLPAQMPFNAMGSLLNVTGDSKVMLSKIVEINGVNCAQLDVTTRIDELSVPEELDGEYECKLISKSRYFFDIKNGVFIKGSTAAKMIMRVDAAMPKMQFKGSEDINIPDRNKMSMISLNYISVVKVGSSN